MCEEEELREEIEKIGKRLHGAFRDAAEEISGLIKKENNVDSKERRERINIAYDRLAGIEAKDRAVLYVCEWLMAEEYKGLSERTRGALDWLAESWGFGKDWFKGQEKQKTEQEYAEEAHKHGKLSYQEFEARTQAALNGDRNKVDEINRAAHKEIKKYDQIEYFRINGDPCVKCPAAVVEVPCREGCIEKEHYNRYVIYKNKVEEVNNLLSEGFYDNESE